MAARDPAGFSAVGKARWQLHDLLAEVIDLASTTR
jgi:hypothetical protein